MKNILKFLKNLILINCFMLGNFVQAHVPCTKIAVQRASADSLPSVNLMQHAVNKKLYEAIDDEIKELKRRFASQAASSEKLISIMQAGAPEIAPALYQLLSKKTERLAKKAKVEVEDILINVSQDKETYNMFAKMITLTTITEGDPDVKESRTNKLVVGEQALKLFLWNFNDLNEVLSAVIAHEIGHMWCEHKGECKKNEFEADLVGKCLLDDPKALNKGVNMLTLAGNLFNSISKKSAECGVTMNEVFNAVCVVTNTIANSDGGDLGWLGKSSSHTKFSFTVDQAVETASKTGGITDKNFLNNVCSNVLLSCKTKNGLFTPEVDRQLTVGLKKMEDALNVAGVSPITHPTPLERSVYSTACDNALVK